MQLDIIVITLEQVIRCVFDDLQAAPTRVGIKFKLYETFFHDYIERSDKKIRYFFKTLTF